MSQTEVLEMLAQNGFVLVRQRKHKIFKHPSGRIWITPSTPSDTRAWENNLSDLRRFILRDRARGIFDAVVPSAPLATAAPPATVAAPTPDVQTPMRALGISIEKFNRMRKHAEQSKRPEGPRAPRPQLCEVRQPQQSDGKKREKHKLVGMQEIGVTLQYVTSGRFSMYVKLTVEDIDPTRELNKLDADNQELVLAALDQYNARVDRAAASAAAKLQNAIRDMRKGKRVRKNRVRAKLYEGFARIFEGEMLLTLSCGSGSIPVMALVDRTPHAHAIALADWCIQNWKLIQVLSKTCRIETEGTKVICYSPDRLSDSPANAPGTENAA